VESGPVEAVVVGVVRVVRRRGVVVEVVVGVVVGVGVGRRVRVGAVERTERVGERAGGALARKEESVTRPGNTPPRPPLAPGVGTEPVPPRRPPPKHRHQ